MNDKKVAEELYKEGTEEQFDTQEIKLGPWTSYSLINDPKHMCFVLSRYKFCAKMLEGKKSVMEVGSGDGFGIPIIAQSVEKVYAADWDQRLLDGIKQRLPHISNIEYKLVDFNKESLNIKVDAIYAIDVIEHIEPEGEKTFLENILKSLNEDGVLILGTPNITASKYATKRSEIQHINLKSMKSLKDLLNNYFKNVFMFGMNDEIVHTGYSEMSHYIWGMGVGLRNL